MPNLNWRIVESWLSRRVPARSREPILADLEADYRHERARSRVRAVLWLWREAWSLARAYAVEADCRRARPWRLTGVGVDLRSAYRASSRAPLSSIVIVVTLSLAIGAATAAFAIFD